MSAAAKDQARWQCLKEVHAEDAPPNGAARRVLGRVHQVAFPNESFVSGRVVVGDNCCIRFDSYSFSNGSGGYFLGPIHIRPHHNPLQRGVLCKSLGTTPGTALYGVVVPVARGTFRFDSAVVAPELGFFVDALHRGIEYVHKHRDRLFFPDGRGDLYAAACLLMKDAHTLMYECLPAKLRPPNYRPLKLTVPPVHFAILMSCLTASKDVFHRFSRLLHQRATSLEPGHLAMLQVRLPTLQDSVRLTAECVTTFAKQQQTVCAARFEARAKAKAKAKGGANAVSGDGGAGGPDSDDESVGSLEDDGRDLCNEERQGAEVDDFTARKKRRVNKDDDSSMAAASSPVAQSKEEEEAVEMAVQSDDESVGSDLSD
jgi:hypothetical protein